MSINPTGDETYESPETFVLTTFAISDDGIIAAISEPVLLADLIRSVFGDPFAEAFADAAAMAEPWVAPQCHEGHDEDCGV